MGIDTIKGIRGVNKDLELRDMQERTEASALEMFRLFFVRNVSLFVGLLVILGAILRVTLSDFAASKLIVTFFVGSLLIGNSIFVRKKGLSPYNGYVILVSVFIIILNGVFWNGGLQAPIASGVFLLPLVGAILLDKKGGQIGFALTIGLIVFCVLGVKLDFVHSFNGSNREIFFPLIYGIISVVTFLIINTFLQAQQESKKITQELNQSMLVRAQMSSLLEMAEGMAHEINNPLAIIVGKADQLKRGLNQDVPKEQILRDIEKIRESSLRISKIVNALLKFSEGSLDESLGVHKVTEIIKSVTEMVDLRCKQRNINIEIDCDQEIQITAKRNHFKFMLLNILQNAVDAVENLDERWIKIHCSEVNRHIEIAITDSGKGISPDIREKIMQPFFSTKDLGKGTGMGLSAAQGIAHSMGGTLVYDGASTNTRFVFRCEKGGRAKPS